VCGPVCGHNCNMLKYEWCHAKERQLRVYRCFGCGIAVDASDNNSDEAGGNDLQSSTFRLKLNAFCGTGGASRCCLGGVYNVVGGITDCLVCILCQKRLRLS
jgi:hypothetical protein